MDYLSFAETRQLISEKLNADPETVAHEIAAWVGLRNLTAYQKIQEANGNGRFIFEAKNPESPYFGQ